MIRYPILSLDEDKSEWTKEERVKKERAKLAALVEAYQKGWFKRAQRKLEACKAAQSYVKSDEIWNSIINVYRKIQLDKCAYCESRIKSTEGDIDHYRPKSAVKSWPNFNDKNCKNHKDQLKGFIPDTPSRNGYYLLSFDLLNYLLSCPNCNQKLKKSFFPIAGSRISDGDLLAVHSDEVPLLIYPLGSIDQNPETLIEFINFMPFPRCSDSNALDFRRALANICFFNLDQESALLKERANMLMLLYVYLFIVKDQNIVDNLLLSSSPHANCVRSFYRLCKSDKAFADQNYSFIKEYLSSKSP